MAEEDPRRRRRKLSAIMMADVSGFSRLMGANEDSTVNLIQDFHARVRQLVEAHEGRVVDTAGDSVFGEFDSVLNALDCARRIQEQQTEINAAQSGEPPIEMRIGVHLGDVIVEDYNVYGDGVNIAARLEGLADPGGIVISEAVYDQVRNKLDTPVRDLGLHELKNINHPVHVYEVRVAAAKPPPASQEQPAREQDRGLEPHPGATPPQVSADLASWRSAITRPKVLIPMLIGLFLLVSPMTLFPSGGVLPTLGALLFAVVVGRVWGHVEKQRGALQFALGIAVASAAIWTNWSRVTNSLLILAGLIVAATGFRSSRKGRKPKTGRSKYPRA